MDLNKTLDDILEKCEELEKKIKGKKKTSTLFMLRPLQPQKIGKIINQAQQINAG